MDLDITTEINNIIESFGQIDDKPFLKHLDYFKDDNDDINITSIGEQWSALSGEYRIKTYLKGLITIKGANYSINSCPYRSNFDSDTMMNALKHPCDTGIVNKDGSINMILLKNFIEHYFVYDFITKQYILTKKCMEKYLVNCVERDINLPYKINWNMPSFQTVARAEWNDFFLNYTDMMFYFNDGTSDQSVTLKTFLQFYFVPNVLYNRVLNKELPVTI